MQSVSNKLQFKKLTDSAKRPKKAHKADAAFDLYLSEQIAVEENRVQVASTGIAVDLPEGTCGLITERSSYGVDGLVVVGGLIDAGYRGEVKIPLTLTHAPRGQDFEGEALLLDKGTRPAQMIVMPICRFEGVEEVQKLSSSERQQGGFGSSNQQEDGNQDL